MTSETLYSISGPKTLPEMTWEEAAAALKQTDICLIGVGAIGQAGAHLPLGAAAFSATETLRAAQRRLAEEGIRVVVGPTIAFGMNPGAMPYAGSLNFQPETVKGILMDMGESLYQQGFRKLAFFVGHADNMHVMGVSAQKLVMAHPDLTVLTLNPTPALLEAAGRADLAARLLASHPNLVRLDRAHAPAESAGPAQREIAGGSAPFCGGGVFNPAAELRQREAADPRPASAEAGRQSYAALAGWVAEVIKRDFLGR